MRFKDLSLRLKIMLGALLPVFLLGVVGVTTIININGMSDSNKLVEHTHHVIANAKHIVSSAVDMETGMRGFLLAGKDSFLDPYRN